MKYLIVVLLMVISAPALTNKDPNLLDKPITLSNEYTAATIPTKDGLFMYVSSCDMMLKISIDNIKEKIDLSDPKDQQRIISFDTIRQYYEEDSLTIWNDLPPGSFHGLSYAEARVDILNQMLFWDAENAFRFAQLCITEYPEYLTSTLK